MKMKKSLLTRLTLVICLSAVTGVGMAQVPSPRDVFGFTPGDDYKLASYDQMIDYFKKLDAASDRVQMREIGKSVLDRPLLQLFISSEENMKELAEWRAISEELARAKVDESRAQELARTGKAVVWIDGGLHATELAHGQMTSLLAYRIATEDSREMQFIRDNVIVLLMPQMNPDGLEIVRRWYERNLRTPFETTRPPELYHHYVGHDNNRDWFMNNMPETQAVNRVLYTEWFPQIVYNHHQTGPAWARIFIPPFADPVNPNIHPGVTSGVNIVGSAMANRFALKEMPGAVSDMIYSMWWNGGMRTVPYFHNMVGILTETSHATPSPRFYDPARLPKYLGNPRRGTPPPTDGTDVFYPYPWKGGESHFSDPVRYMIEGSIAVLDVAAKMRENWLLGIYRMGRDEIERGSSQTPAAYIIPASQWDSGEAANLVNILTAGGVEAYRVTRAGQVGEVTFEAGDYVIPSAQAFRPYVVDLMEKQVHPDRRRTPDGPPEPPYDVAGWTLPMQMGVSFVRASGVPDGLEAIEGPVTPGGSIAGAASFGWAFSHQPNASIRAVNHLLKAGDSVLWAKSTFSAGGEDWPSGTFVVKTGSGTEQRLQALSRDLGLDFHGLETQPSDLVALRAPRIGLYKSWDASMDEGWTRWVLDTYEFGYRTLHDADVRSGNLSDLDVIILPSQSPESILNGHARGTMPDEYVGGLGVEGTAALNRFVNSGGRIVALDEAADFAIEQLGLPVENVVRGIPSESFFIPGSLIRVEVETSHPLAHGMPGEAAASFQDSRAFEEVRLSRTGEGGRENIPEAPALPVEVIANYPKGDLLMSGWALGADRYIAGKAAIMRVGSGQGDVVLFGFRPQFRGQPRGTYKLLFNSLLKAGH